MNSRRRAPLVCVTHASDAKEQAAKRAVEAERKRKAELLPNHPPLANLEVNLTKAAAVVGIVKALDIELANDWKFLTSNMALPEIRIEAKLSEQHISAARKAKELAENELLILQQDVAVLRQQFQRVWCEDAKLDAKEFRIKCKSLTPAVKTLAIRIAHNHATFMEAQLLLSNLQKSMNKLCTADSKMCCATGAQLDILRMLHLSAYRVIARTTKQFHDAWDM
jgi:hypothetical protein